MELEEVSWRRCEEDPYHLHVSRSEVGEGPLRRDPKTHNTMVTIGDCFGGPNAPICCGIAGSGGAPVNPLTLTGIVTPLASETAVEYPSPHPCVNTIPAHAALPRRGCFTGAGKLDQAFVDFFRSPPRGGAFTDLLMSILLASGHRFTNLGERL